MQIANCSIVTTFIIMILLSTTFKVNSAFRKAVCASSCNFRSCTPLYRSALVFTDTPTIGEVYKVSSNWLQERSVEDGEDSARHMLCHATRIGSRFSDFNRNIDRTMGSEEVKQYIDMCNARANREPVQYIIGNWDFYGLTLKCKAPILIPRPETEELVERILNSGILQGIEHPRILDVGAGTGAIGLALLSQLPEAACCAIDLNAQAVALATENAQSVLGSAHATRFHCLHADFRSFVAEFCRQSANHPQAQAQAPITRPYQQPFDLIVSNPPYIPRNQLATLQPEIRDFEDVRALDGGEDGLDIVRDLVYLAPSLLRGQGKELWLEVAEEHPRLVEEWMQSGSYRVDKERFWDAWWASGNDGTGAGIAVSRHGATFVSGMNDLSGNPRFLRIKY